MEGGTIAPSATAAASKTELILTILAATLAGLQRRAAAITDHAQVDVIYKTIGDASREAITTLHRAVAANAKALDAAVEAAEVASEQLDAFGCLFDIAAANSSDAACDVAVLSRLVDALLMSPAELPLPWHALTSATSDGNDIIAFELISELDVAQGVVTGSGVGGYVVGADANNNNLLRIAFSTNVTIDEHDVTIEADGATVSLLHTLAPGVVECGYSVPDDHDTTTTITLSAFALGYPLPGSPWTVPEAVLVDSEVLLQAPQPARTTFMRQLSTCWLPRRAYTLLYRGTRDGMSPVPFHARCDDMGPTLTLIHAYGGEVFGGYTRTAWRSHGFVGESYYLAGDDTTCLFGVTGPFGVARFRLLACDSDRALYSSPHLGPGFGYGGLTIDADPYHGGLFKNTSNSTIGPSFESPGSMACLTNGSDDFLPLEVEVYGVREC